MRKIEWTTIEQLKSLIRHLQDKDFDKLREVIDEEILNRRNAEQGIITNKRAKEILKNFHDDFYNEEKDFGSQKELRNALRLALTKFEDQE